MPACLVAVPSRPHLMVAGVAQCVVYETKRCNVSRAPCDAVLIKFKTVKNPNRLEKSSPAQSDDGGVFVWRFKTGR